ncbi:MAG TPA: amino acid ABC transporter permease [Castellaniella sp.]|uniref:amino acid ABC transporter permease n=1 Tax=Castellaniella sp. TaxID=1955812 RepID=UPI002F1CC1B7
MRFSGRTDLPVLVPEAVRALGRLSVPGESQPLRLTGALGVGLLVLFVASCGVAQAQSGAQGASAFAALWKWTPLLARGFLLNLAISALSMLIGTILGCLLGFGQIALSAWVRKPSWLVTQFFRNAPWLVLLFYCMYLLPFRVTVLGDSISIPGWVKATFGLSLPVMANVSEILRGAVQSIPTGQWESAASLAFTRRWTLWMVILPQCIKRMLPPWMNLYSILTMATVLASIVGVNELLTQTARALSAEDQPGLLLPFYSYDLLWFFAYCYPIARLTLHLERRYAVHD